MRQPLRTSSPAKRRLIEFLQADANEEFEFVLDCDEAAARSYIHHMRVELSRLRKLVRDAGRPLTPMKMRVLAVEPNGNQTRIVLYKDRLDDRVVQQLTDIFPELAS